MARHRDNPRLRVRTALTSRVRPTPPNATLRTGPTTLWGGLAAHTARWDGVAEVNDRNVASRAARAVAAAASTAAATSSLGRRGDCVRGTGARRWGRRYDLLVVVAVGAFRRTSQHKRVRRADAHRLDAVAWRCECNLYRDVAHTYLVGGCLGAARFSRLGSRRRGRRRCRSAEAPSEAKAYNECAALDERERVARATRHRLNANGAAARSKVHMQPAWAELVACITVAESPLLRRSPPTARAPQKIRGGRGGLSPPREAARGRPATGV